MMIEMREKIRKAAGHVGNAWAGDLTWFADNAPSNEIDAFVSALAAQSAAPVGEPVAWIAFAGNGNIRFWTADATRATAEKERGLDLRMFTLSEFVALAAAAPSAPQMKEAIARIVLQAMTDKAASVAYGASYALNINTERAKKAADQIVAVLSAKPGDQTCTREAREKEITRLATIEECARVAEMQAQQFLSLQYASNQPFGFLCERFACEEVAKAIRALSEKTGEQP